MLLNSYLNQFYYENCLYIRTLEIYCKIFAVSLKETIQFNSKSSPLSIQYPKKSTTFSMLIVD